MNIIMTQNSVKVTKVGAEKETEESYESYNKAEMGRAVFDSGNNNVKTSGRKHQNVNERPNIHKQLEDLVEMNRLLKKQLESRDVIIKKQISEIHRLQGQNKALSEEKNEMKKEKDGLMKEYETEKWLGERLRHDIRDLEIQLDFQDCYLQEQAHQSNLKSNLLDGVQKKNEAQEQEIAQLRTQLQSGKEKLDNQIEDLQKMLGIRLKIPK